MELVNLVYNRLGNSVSLLLDYPSLQIQLLDKVFFSVEQVHCSVAGISFSHKEGVKVRLEVGSIGSKELLFNGEGFFMSGLGFFKPVEGGFYGFPENVFLSFRLGMEGELDDRGGLKIEGEGFFRKVCLLILKSYEKY